MKPEEAIAKLEHMIVSYAGEKGQCSGLTDDEWDEEIDMCQTAIQALEKQTKEEKKLEEIWKRVNNAHYFSDMKARNFYNLIHEVAEIIKPGYKEIGKEYMEEEG